MRNRYAAIATRDSLERVAGDEIIERRVQELLNEPDPLDWNFPSGATPNSYSVAIPRGGSAYGPPAYAAPTNNAPITPYTPPAAQNAEFQPWVPVQPVTAEKQAEHYQRKIDILQREIEALKNQRNQSWEEPLPALQ